MNLKEIKPLLLKIKTSLPYLVYLSLFIFLALPTAKLTLFLDDNVHIFPALLKEYKTHFIEYQSDYGLFRPLSLFFFYFIYSFYLSAPLLSHLLILAIHIYTGFLLGKVLQLKIDRLDSFLVSIIYITLPFFTEQYGWFAASNITVANLVFILQLETVVDKKRSFLRKAVYLFLLQTVIVLIYETYFFTFIPLVYLLLKENKQSLFSKKSLAIFLVFALPSISYALLRNTVFVPKMIVARDIRLTDLITGKGFFQIKENLVIFFNHISYLFFSKSSWIFFWKLNLIEGIKTIANNKFALLAFMTFTGLLLYQAGTAAIKQKNYSYLSLDATRNQVAFWLMIGGLSLVPALLIVDPSFPFRVIALPTFSLILFLLVKLRQYWIKETIFITCFMAIISSIYSFQILDKMAIQANHDNQLFNSIVATLDDKLEPGMVTTVVFTNVPLSTQTEYSYGEYLVTCSYYNWCAEAAFSRRTDKVWRVIVNPPSLESSTNYGRIIFRYNKNNQRFDLVSKTPNKN